ncbi:MAG: protein translocase subunit SecD [Inconstantimicrobium porci]|uniref:Protein translocase subunit SecD n=1 Tax=Inconstantimicrobium porci TaxID=2652291 RepID=A0A7X2MVG9_9CLOT|nr:protein translocase subunit SecD [Inconstantimicrobium porci]MDD6770204.1 protein translocase subunit SecD [Inconstantimicrobium porci]MDY5912520.1 protein translocase subunit SecD [Inconstantimicrobium porci]MSR89843.1 protein translocase subunit SecD [Inconstantimicrobium porci]
MKKKVTSTIVFILCFIAICIVAFAGFKGFKLFSGENEVEVIPFEQQITKGLDLQGGVSVLMEVQADNVSKEELDSIKQLISLRVNGSGVGETVITEEGQKRIRVDIPGQYDSKKIVDSLSKTGDLKFVDPEGKTILTGKDVKKATAYLDESSQPQIGLEFNDAGKKKFAEATSKFIGKNIKITMDGETISDATVNTAIIDGNARIEGSKSLDDAKEKANIISAGAFPHPIKTASVRTVGAQLGNDSLPNAMKAGAIALAIIFVFMIVYYRVPGFISCMSLSLYTVMVLWAFKEIGVVLTLPGIAAFILTIGMAIDANVLIFERTREELRLGRSIASSIKLGIDNAMSSIIDSNLTTIIAALILYFFGSGSVKGFALTLLVGVVLSMVTAIFITKFFMYLALNMGILKKPSYFRVKRG